MCRFWGVAALAAVVVVVGAGCLPAPPSGNPPPLTLFPSDGLTVPDPAQATGKRVDLPKPADCMANKSECDEITLIDKLDGFDLDPAISVHFSGAIDVAKVTDDSVYVEPTGGGARIGVNRLVWDGSTTTLYAHPKQQLHEASEYRLVVTPAVNGQTGTSTFTTMSATRALTRMRQQIDDGSAYTSAGITDRGLSLDQDGTHQPAAYSAATIVPVVGMTRTEDIGSGKTQTEQVFDSALPGVSNAGTYAFGSFDAPQWLDADLAHDADAPDRRVWPYRRTRRTSRVRTGHSHWEHRPQEVGRSRSSARASPVRSTTCSSRPTRTSRKGSQPSPSIPSVTRTAPRARSRSHARSRQVP